MDNKRKPDANRTVTPTVYVVDDDADFGEWVAETLSSLDVRVKTYRAPLAFLNDVDPDDLGCILLDVRLPELSGKLVHRRLIENRVLLPVMMVTAYAEVTDAVEAIKAGAVDYIQKPVSTSSLISRVQHALQLAFERQQVHRELASIQSRYESLSPREVEVLDLLLEGKATKQIAAALNIGMTTVDYHRHNMLEKMQAENLVDLTQVIERYRSLVADAGG